MFCLTLAASSGYSEDTLALRLLYFPYFVEVRSYVPGFAHFV
jgi:hypothetical protein